LKFLKVKNVMGRGIMINEVTITGDAFENANCSITPNTILPKGTSNPLSGSFNGHLGLRLLSDQSVTIPIKCSKEISGAGYGATKGKGSIGINWYLEYSDPGVSHVAQGEIVAKIKEGKCKDPLHFVEGPDSTFACCSGQNDYAINWQCFTCPVNKPYLAYTNTLTTGSYADEVIFGLENPPFYNDSAKIVVPCNANILSASLEVSNQRNYANDSNYFSTVVLTDVSGSMDWTFSGFGTSYNRLCTSNLIFDSATKRIALARCLQTGISYTGFEFSGIIRKLTDGFLGNRVGLVTFTDYGTITSQLSSDANQLSQAVNVYTALYSTNMVDGFVKSVDVLNTNNPNNVNYIILISDGESNVGGDPETYVCNPSFPTNIAVYILGIGPVYQFQSGHEGDCNFLTNPAYKNNCIKMKNIASCTNGGFYSGMTPESTMTAINQILGVIMNYPSNLKVLDIQYSGVLKGTYSNPATLTPLPNITSQVQTFSNLCGGSSEIFPILITSDSKGVVLASNIEMLACSATYYP